MLVAYLVSQAPAVMAILPDAFKFAAPVFAFGLVAFGFLGMGPVTIAVDSFGPVSDNAQSIYELSMIESRPDAKEVVKKHFGVTPDFEQSKHFLESGDGAGNTFKATAKPVLIGTAVVAPPQWSSGSSFSWRRCSVTSLRNSASSSRRSSSVSSWAVA